MLKVFACLSQYYGEEFNFGFMDYRKSEKVWMAYEALGSYGTMAPYVILFDKGTAYHLNQGKIAMLRFIEFLGNYTAEHELKEPIRYARDEANIYWEYLKKDVGKNKHLIKATKYLNKELNNTWILDEVITPYFGLA